MRLRENPGRRPKDRACLTPRRSLKSLSRLYVSGRTHFRKGGRARRFRKFLEPNRSQFSRFLGSIQNQWIQTGLNPKPVDPKWAQSQFSLFQRFSMDSRHCLFSRLFFLLFFAAFCWVSVRNASACFKQRLEGRILAPLGAECFRVL